MLCKPLLYRISEKDRVWPLVDSYESQSKDCIVMRILVIACALLMTASFPNLAVAQNLGVSQNDSAVVSNPLEDRVDGYRMLSIAAGAVGGAMVANIVVGGVFAPAMMGGAATSGTLLTLARGAVVAAGSVAGGYLGDWYYSK